MQRRHPDVLVRFHRKVAQPLDRGRLGQPRLLRRQQLGQAISLSPTKATVKRQSRPPPPTPRLTARPTEPGANMKELRQIVRATRQLRRTRLPVNENLDLDLTQLATLLLAGWSFWVTNRLRRE